MKRMLAFVYNNVDVFQGEFRSQVGSRDRDCVFVFLCFEGDGLLLTHF